jgi:hypothetical protein
VGADQAQFLYAGIAFTALEYLSFRVSGRSVWAAELSSIGAALSGAFIAIMGSGAVALLGYVLLGISVLLGIRRRRYR